MNLYMKKLLLIICVATLASCYETPPAVDFSAPDLFLLEKKVTVLEVAERPDVVGKNVLIEDITGVRCKNCPDAAERAREIKELYPDRVVVVGLYTGLFPTLTGSIEGDQSLSTQEASDIHSILYGGVPLPGGGVNRKLYEGQSSINQIKTVWLGRTNAELDLDADVNLNGELTWVNDTTLDLAASMYFQNSIGSQVYFTIMLLEDGIVTKQVGSDGSIIEHYEHEHVLRKTYTPYQGSPLINEPSEGDEVDITWRMYLPNDVNYQKSSVVLFINLNDENNKEVLQCLELKMK